MAVTFYECVCRRRDKEAQMQYKEMAAAAYFGVNATKKEMTKLLSEDRDKRPTEQTPDDLKKTFDKLDKAFGL